MKNQDEKAMGTGAALGGVSGGVAGAAMAGAAAGGVTGPVGAVAGAVIGAAAGAMAGKGLSKTADLAQEDAYWRSNYRERPYAQGRSYDDYGPAYLYGAGAHERYPGRSFDEIEAELRGGWTAGRGTSTLEWDDAQHASRDAWMRVYDASRS